ncbi:AbfB domain-containing protein [Streptoverticillium reticulum]|uniref:AbfB domain-containing protein n=1 Tax=Streptoverticillium reticulum TaxID=1433415 RepID=UPI0039BEF8C9
MHKSHITSARMRRVIKRGIVTTTALAAVAGVVAPVAVVATASDAVASAAGVSTDEKQRVDAAAVVHLDPSPDVLLLSDRDFVHALWQKAKDAGENLESVRLAAEAAMISGSADDQVRFITTGIHEAYEVDKQREKDRSDADRAARLAKSQALIAVGIPASPDLLGLSDDNFVRAVMKHEAAGPEVKDAAAKALAGDAAAWREFITNGAREAHQRDVANELKDLEQKNREEAERRKELAARKNAAALFGTTPSEAQLSLSDDNFIRELLRGMPLSQEGRYEGPSPELYAAAQRAVLSSDPADWKKFIHTGAEEAYKLDDKKRREKIVLANKLLAQQRTAAADPAVNPAYVAAGLKATKGDDAEAVTNFLKEETQYRLKRQSLQASNMNGWYIRQSDADAGEAFLAPVDAKGKQTDREDATWVIVPALAKGSSAGQCYSFESARKRGYYLAQKDLRVKMLPDDDSDAFRKNATWCARKNAFGSGVSFESASLPGRWLRQFWGDLYAADKSGKNRFDAADAFAQDATWKISAPLAR